MTMPNLVSSTCSYAGNSVLELIVVTVVMVTHGILEISSLQRRSSHRLLETHFQASLSP